MEAVLEGLRITQIVVLAGLAVAALAKWRSLRGEPTGWLAATIALLAAGSLANHVLPETTPAGTGAFEGVVLGRKALIVTVVFVPYSLFRFAGAFDLHRDRLRRLAAVTAAAVAAWTVALPSVPGRGEPRTWYVLVLGVLLSLHWTYLTAAAVWRLWVLGRGQPTVARRRMHMLALGAVSINVAPIAAAAAPGERGSGVEVATTVFALVSAVFFYLGYFLPAVLRRSLRRAEEKRFNEAARDLIVAASEDEVARTVLPHVAAILGARGVMLVDDAGRVLGVHGLDPEEAGGVLAEASRAEHDGGRSPSRVVGVPVAGRRLVAVTSPLTPFLGEAELELMGALAVSTGLALERAALFERERAARVQVERVNEELGVFVRSVSHDLESSLVAVAGDVDVLHEEFGKALPEAGHRYVERMAASAAYMRALIDDLRELSAIGHWQAEPADVDLGALITRVVAEIGARHPAARFTVGSLPAVRLNSLRARQLFTNLLVNAVEHAGRRDVRVEVTAHVRGSDGTAVVSVADNGPGIPEPYRDRVFEPFRRLAGPGGPHGTGIGLSICKKIVEMAGGRIWVEGGEEGAIFRMELALAEREGEQWSQQPRSRRRPLPQPVA